MRIDNTELQQITKVLGELKINEAWFLESLEPVIPKSTWRAITYRIEYSPNLRSWNKALSGIITEVGIKRRIKDVLGKEQLD